MCGTLQCYRIMHGKSHPRQLCKNSPRKQAIEFDLKEWNFDRQRWEAKNCCFFFFFPQRKDEHLWLTGCKPLWSLVRARQRFVCLPQKQMACIPRNNSLFMSGGYASRVGWAMCWTQTRPVLLPPVFFLFLGEIRDTNLKGSQSGTLQFTSIEEKTAKNKS